jgi:hypothetical protein
MAKKILVARLGVGSMMLAFCAGLPGCNLAVHRFTYCPDGEESIGPCPPRDSGRSADDARAADAKEAAGDGAQNTDGRTDGQ